MRGVSLTQDTMRLVRQALEGFGLVGAVAFGLEGLRLITGCEFSAAQEPLVVATEEGNSSIREWCGQKNAEDSEAQPDTKCR
jgi:hypothetical protein